MIELRNASYTYPGAHRPAATGVSLTVAPGEYVVLIGANGSGKSTIARLAAGSLLPSSGRVVVDGHNPAASASERIEVARLCGFLRQDPTDQLVSSSVRDEVAFGPCNLGLPCKEVERRVERVLELCKLDTLAARGVDELSGGEQQRLALAGVLAMDGAYLVLDEALSFLDSRARQDLRSIISSLVAAGHGVLAVSHDLADILGATRICLVEGGQITWTGEPQALLADASLVKRAQLGSDGLARLMPALVSVGFNPADGAGVADVLAFVHKTGRDRWLLDVLGGYAHSLKVAGVPSLVLGDAYKAFGDVAALDGMDVLGHDGEVTLLAGASGSGKSTALRALAGVLELDSGRALLYGRPIKPGSVGLAFQRPEEQLFCDTVIEDVAFGPKNRGVGEARARARATEVLETLGVEKILWERSPFALSGGQARRVALAGIVAMGAEAFVFDEPTAGLDAAGREALHRLIASLAAEGASVVVVSHDVDEWLSQADTVVLAAQGKVVWEGEAWRLAADPQPFEAAGLEAPMTVRLRAGIARRH